VNAGPANPSIGAGALFTQGGSFTQPGNTGRGTATVNYGERRWRRAADAQSQQYVYAEPHLCDRSTPTVTVTVIDATGGVAGTGTATLTVNVQATHAVGSTV